MNRASLTVVGTGIKGGFHTTPEARHAIETADRVFHLTNEPVSAAWIAGLHPRAESLADAYREGRSRHEAYATMVERILAPLREGLSVCAAFYGHPGVFVRPSHEAIRRARQEGFEATMLPGVSAEDALYADLELEPALTGCQRYEATDFLLYPRSFDPRSALVLWQVGTVGRIRYREDGAYGGRGLRVLAEVLSERYGTGHEAVLYEAAETPASAPRRERLALAALPEAAVTPRTTLYVPPLPPTPPDEEMLARLGLLGKLGGIDPETWRRTTRGATAEFSG